MMKKLLLIEDDDYKAFQIRDFLEEEGYHVDIRSSFQSGMKTLVSDSYHLLLLDMSIPTFETVKSSQNNRYRPFGGVDILKELQRRELRIPVIVVTQYSVFGEDRENITREDLDESLTEQFESIYQGMVYFDASSLDWTFRLRELLKEADAYEA